MSNRRSTAFDPIPNRIDGARFGKSFEPQQTTVATTARETFGRRIVTTVRERVIDPQFKTSFDYLRLAEFNKRRVNVETYSPFNTRFRRKIRRSLKGFDVFGSAIGISAVIERIDADEYIAGLQHFGPSECE